MSEDKQTLQSEIEILKKELSSWKNEAYEMSKELGEYRNKEQEREEKIGSKKSQFVEGLIAFLIGVNLSALVLGGCVLFLPFYIIDIIYKLIKHLIEKSSFTKVALLDSVTELARLINTFLFFGIIEFNGYESKEALERGMSAGVSFVFWYILTKYCDLPIMMIS